ncbi:MAG: NUDIX domain-containing protein [Rubrobacter sp.]|nr:NUDIX domain-containing protein [Rubrobacter sp.]
MDEWIDVLDESGAKTGESVLKSEAHRAGLWHRCFHCWVLWEDGSGGAHLLAQRRAFGKDTWPGWLDVSVAGHLGAGEAPLDGKREIEEEIGLSVPPERLVPLGERRVEHEIPQGLDREYHDVFILFDRTPPERMILQKEEVDALVSVKLDDARAMAEGETVSATEYKDGETSDINVSLPDFVLGSGDYIRRVVEAARRLAAGESVGRVF